LNISIPRTKTRIQNKIKNSTEIIVVQYQLRTIVCGVVEYLCLVRSLDTTVTNQQNEYEEKQQQQQQAIVCRDGTVSYVPFFLAKGTRITAIAGVPIAFALFGVAILNVAIPRTETSE
jgi:hypothetical protein